MESQPQNPEFRNNPENFHPCCLEIATKTIQLSIEKFICFQRFFHKQIFC